MSFRPLGRFGPFGPCPFVPAVLLSFCSYGGFDGHLRGYFFK